MRTASRSKPAGGSLPACMAVLGTVVLLAAALLGCTDLTTTGSSQVTTAMETLLQNSTTMPSGTDSATTTIAPTPTTEAVPTVSAESIAYAAGLGGTSHLGEELYFVIGASVQTEDQAKALLEGAKAVGDMQSSFIVQLSDNFDGMRAGYWVVFEAYHEYPSVEDLEFCRRPFPDAYVKKATVRTSDPIPVR
jgi:hypothetical protein